MSWMNLLCLLKTHTDSLLVRSASSCSLEFVTRLGLFFLCFAFLYYAFSSSRIVCWANLHVFLSEEMSMVKVCLSCDSVEYVCEKIVKSRSKYPGNPFILIKFLLPAWPFVKGTLSSNLLAAWRRLFSSPLMLRCWNCVIVSWVVNK